MEVDLRRLLGPAPAGPDRHRPVSRSTPRFATPKALAGAWRSHVLRAIPRDGHRTHLALAHSFGQEAHKLGRSCRRYRRLRPQALDVLLYIGRRVHDLSGSQKPLLVTSAVRDNRYLRPAEGERERRAELLDPHDGLRIREAAAIHVAVASGAGSKLVLPRRAG